MARSSSLALVLLLASTWMARALRAGRKHPGRGAAATPRTTRELRVLPAYVEQLRLHSEAGQWEFLLDDGNAPVVLLETHEERQQRNGGFFGKKKEVTKLDPNSDEALVQAALAKEKAQGKADVKQIEQLSKAVKAAENKLVKAATEHAELQERLENLQTQSGQVASPQTNSWHGKVYSYTPKKDSWLTLPFWNGHACAVGVMTGPGGHCHRTLGATPSGCSSEPSEKILAATGQYKSKSCQCDMCNGFSGAMMAAPYCHTRGINVCHCMLVDNRIDSEKACIEMQ